MLRIATFFVSVCLISALQAQPELESLMKQELSSRMKLYQAYAKRSNDAGVDIRHVRLWIEPDMSNGKIVNARVDFTFRSKAALPVLELDLRKELQVDSVVYHGSKISFSHSATHLLTLQFPMGILADALDSVSVFYQGTPDMSTRSYSRNVNVSGANISTLSQPYGAHYWWPCRENLIDKIDSLDVILTVDTPYYAVSNGRLVSMNDSNAQRVFHYAHSYPIANYLVAVSFSKYVKYGEQMTLSSTGKPLEIIHHVFPHNDNADNRKKTAATVPIMHLFDSLYGEYPFSREHYGHAQFSWSGGMEHQTMSFMTNFGFDLVAHEMAHQWFGDMVTCGTWKDIWLNEGFATYSNLICYQYMFTASDFRAQLKKNKSDVLSQPDGSVYAYDTGSVSTLFNYRTTYQKGALVLHQLRWYIGDSAYFTGIRHYLRDTLVRYGFARQERLQYHLEQVSGVSLKDYFQDWIMGEGYPQYDILWSQKGKSLEFVITQVPSNAGVSSFEVPIPMRVNGANASVMIRVPVTGLQTVYSVPVDFRVTDVEMDPEEWILAKFKVSFPLSENSAVTLYPNPFNGKIYFSASEFDVLQWELTDACGKSVLSSRSGYSLAKGSIGEIEADALGSGVYFLKLLGPEQTIIKKVIKQ